MSRHVKRYNLIFIVCQVQYDNNRVFADLPVTHNAKLTLIQSYDVRSMLIKYRFNIVCKVGGGTQTDDLVTQSRSKLMTS